MELEPSSIRDLAKAGKRAPPPFSGILCGQKNYKYALISKQPPLLFFLARTLSHYHERVNGASLNRAILWEYANLSTIGDRLLKTGRLGGGGGVKFSFYHILNLH